MVTVAAPPSPTDEKPTTETIGRNIRRLRAEAGLTAEELASLAGISTNQVYRVERGESSPSAETIASLADALKVHPGEFFGGDFVRDEELLELLAVLEEVDAAAGAVQAAQALEQRARSRLLQHAAKLLHKHPSSSSCVALALLPGNATGQNPAANGKHPKLTAARLRTAQHHLDMG